MAWGRTCSSVYSQNNGNICDLPASQRQASFGGSVLVLTDGFPGQVSIADPALDFFGRVTSVGTMGDDPRRLRCLAGICAVSNYGSSTLTILTWDGLYTAAITATVPVVAKLKSLQVSEELTIVFEGENLFNDATAVVVFSLVLLWAQQQPGPASVAAAA